MRTQRLLPGMLLFLITFVPLLEGTSGAVKGMAAVGTGSLLPRGLTCTPLQTRPKSINTGEKPQSKTWQYGGGWWSVFATSGNDMISAGTWLWKLEGVAWREVLQLSPGNSRADVKTTGDVAHILLYSSPTSQLFSVQYQNGTYLPWSERTSGTSLSLPGSEVATIDIDSTGRMWLASDNKDTHEIVVFYSDLPYSAWNGPLTVESGIDPDDIAVVVALPNQTVGVLWSNQDTRRFGFKVHTDGADPAVWGPDEVPASQSALDVGKGMADDHLNVAVASNGTLYAAVKTSYDSPEHSKIALLVRRPSGVWDSLYHVDYAGTRPVVLLDEANQVLSVLYTSNDANAGDIVYKQSHTEVIEFGEQKVIRIGDFNDVSAMKQNILHDFVFIFHDTEINGEFCTQVPALIRSCESDPALVGCWRLDEGAGSAVLDGSSFENHGNALSYPAWLPGYAGSSLRLNGTSQYVEVRSADSLNIPAHITLSAWIKPERRANQDILKKALTHTVDGYELSLDSTGKVFVRFNQVAGGDQYRLASESSYPATGSTWMHIAATYDGKAIRMYINGVEETSRPASFTIAANALPLTIGAQNNASRFYRGQVDEVRIHTRALNSEEVHELYSRLLPPQNRAPVLSAIGNFVVNEEELLALTAAAQDPDGDAVTYSLTGAPAGALIHPITGSFTWTPSEAQGPGEYTFDICASDGELKTCVPVTVTVREVNRPPQLENPGSQTVLEGSFVSLAVKASDPDLPANVLTFSAAYLPPGLVMNPGTGVISGTVQAGSAAYSPYHATVTVSDGLEQASQTFTWEVHNGPLQVFLPIALRDAVPGPLQGPFR